MRVATAFGARWRLQSEDAFDPERHLRRGFSHNYFAVRSRVPRQVDEVRIANLVHSLMDHDRLRSAHKIVNNAGAQVETGPPASSGLE